MTDDQLEGCRPMWTSEIDRYRLLEHPSRKGMEMIFDVQAGGPVVTELEPTAVRELVRRLREAGMTPISPEEAFGLGRSAFDDQNR